MPLLKLETTVALSEDKRQALLASLSKTVAETIGKPQQYVMVTASQAAIPETAGAVQLFGYEGEYHSFNGDNWIAFMERSAHFFDQYVRDSK